MADWSTQYIASLMSRCGRIALEIYEKPVTEMKDDFTLVTEADRAIEELLAGEFDHPARGSYLIGEETVASKGEDYLSAAFAGKTWIVDPIDGTLGYAHHIPTWGVSIGLMDGGRLVHGSVYFPVTRELFLSGDGGTVLYGVGIEAGEEPDPARILPLKKVDMRSAGAGLEGGLVAISQVTAKYGGFAARNPVQALGTAAMPLAYVMLGRYLAYIGAVKLWDVAGAFPLLSRMGCSMRLCSGRRITDTLDPEVYRLDPDDPGRWYLREDIVVSMSDSISDYIVRARTAGSGSGG